MDLTWLILFAIVAIVSSIMNKKAEAQAKKRQEESKGSSRGGPSAPGQQPTDAPRRQAPRSPGPPVSPGPSGLPVPNPRRAPNPRRGTIPPPHMPVTGRTQPGEAPAPPDPADRTVSGRDIFKQMRNRLDEAKRQQEQSARGHFEDAPAEAPFAEKHATPVVRSEPAPVVRIDTTPVGRNEPTRRRVVTRVPASADSDEKSRPTRAAESEIGSRVRKKRRRTLSLSGPDLRRAIILKEVLGSPKALQDDREVWESF